MYLTRINKTAYFKEIVQVVSKRSTCIKVQVGAIIVNEDDKIISIGMNGVSSGHIHCQDFWNEYYETRKEYYQTIEDFINSDEFKNLHSDFQKQNEIHAEVNAIITPSKRELINSSIYVTLSPCIDCAKMIIASGIKNVYYINKYERDLTGIKLLESCNINVKQI